MESLRLWCWSKANLAKPQKSPLSPRNGLPWQHPWQILEHSNWFVSLYAPYIWKSEQYIFMAIHTKGLHGSGQFKKAFPIRQHKCPQAVFQYGHHKKLQNILFPLRNKYCSRLCKIQCSQTALTEEFWTHGRYLSCKLPLFHLWADKPITQSNNVNEDCDGPAEELPKQESTGGTA